MNPAKRKPSSRRGFTLVELLVVAAIIAIVVSMTVAVARSVRTSSRTRATRNILAALENAAEEFFTIRKRYPVMDVKQESSSHGLSYVWPESKVNPGEMEWSCYTFQLMLEMDTVGEAKAAMAAVPERYVRRFEDLDLDPSDVETEEPGLAVTDAWGHLIQYFTINERVQMKPKSTPYPEGVAMRKRVMWIPTALDLDDPHAIPPKYDWLQWPAVGPDLAPGMPGPNTPKPLFMSPGPDGKFGYYCQGEPDDNPRIVESRRDNVYSTDQPPPHDPSRQSGSEPLRRWWEGPPCAGGGGGPGAAQGPEQEPGTPM